MAMYHPKHRNGNYEIDNLVIAFEQDRVIAWQPGDGGWTWRYDLTPLGAGRGPR